MPPPDPSPQERASSGGPRSPGGDGRDAQPPDDDSAFDRVAALKEQRADLEDRIAKQSRLRDGLTVAVLVYLLSILVLGFARYANAGGWVTLGVTFVGVVSVLQVTRARIRDLEDNQQQVEYELAVIGSDPGEPTAETLFLKHQFELRRYYGQILRQAGVIFYVGIACLLFGLGVIAAAVWLIHDAQHANTTAALIAALGAVGGLATDYVAFVYLRMHARAIQSVAQFHTTLVRTQSIHFSHLLVMQLSEEERAQHLGSIAEELASQGAIAIREGAEAATDPADVEIPPEGQT